MQGNPVIKHPKTFHLSTVKVMKLCCAQTKNCEPKLYTFGNFDSTYLRKISWKGK